MLKITIPEPCHQDWKKMLPRQQGRFCNSCAKTVIDFTLMSDDDVRDYFTTNKDQKVCGRFTNVQLSRITINLPENIFVIEMPFWKRFLTAALIVFSMTLFSCNTNHDAAKQFATSPVEAFLQKVPSNYDPRGQVGGMVITFDSIPPTTTCTTTVGFTIPQIIVGDVEVIPPPIDTVRGETIQAKWSPDTTQPGNILVGEIAPIKTDTPKFNKPVVKQLVNPPKVDTCENKSYQ